MKKNLFIFLIFLTLTIILTYPLMTNVNTYIPGFFSTDEPYGDIWNFWRIKYSLQNKISLAFCPFISAPFGRDIRFGSANYPLWEFVNMLLAISTNEILTYNLWIIFSFITSGFFMYLLMYYLTKNSLVACFSGIIYTFCPYHFVRSWQHLGLAQIQWIPLYIFALMRLRDLKKYKETILVALAFFLVTCFNYQYTYSITVITFVFILFVITFDRKQSFKTVQLTLISMILAFFFVLSLVYPIFKTVFPRPKPTSLTFTGFVCNFSDLFSQSAKPLGYLLPATMHPIFGKFTEYFIGSQLYGVSFTEHTLYLGWVPLIFAFAAFRRWRKRRGQLPVAGCQSLGSREDFCVGFFIFLAIVAWFFSQPPWWKIGPIRIFMPSFFMYKIFPMFRAYCRFGIVVMLAVSVLAGFGLKAILERFKTKKKKYALTILLSGIVLFEFWNYPPFKVIDLSKAPEAYYWIKKQPGDFAIAEYPLDADTTNETYRLYQTKHEKRIINGTANLTHANRVAKTITKLSELYTAEVLKWMGVKYVLVHKEDYLRTELVEEISELEKIAHNPGLKLIRSFPQQECLREDIMCVKKTGPVDVYEVVAQPSEPRVDEVDIVK